MNSFRRIATTLFATAISCAATLPLASSSFADDQEIAQGQNRGFDIDRLLQDGYRNKLIRASSRDRALVRDQGLRLMTTAQRDVVLVDASLASSGIVTSTSLTATEISWVAQLGAHGYTILRDGKKIASLPAGVTHFRDESVRPGGAYRYVIALTAVFGDQDLIPVWGVRVALPVANPVEHERDTMERHALEQAKAAAATENMWLTWETFIPQARIDAPATSCDYGSGYEFGGDDRGFSTAGLSHRTSVTANIIWSAKTVSMSRSIGVTRVYRKSDGALVASATASAEDMNAYKLGSSADQLDIRMETKASNPFCSLGAIEGAVTVELTQNGNWAFRSGSHRQMPSHHIFIKTGCATTSLYAASYQHPACLIGPGACETAQLGSLYGTY